MPKTAAATLPEPVSAQIPRAAPPVFVAPPVEVGQTVLWRYGPGERPTAALVIKVATQSITVAVHVDGTKDHYMKNGVRHVDDPFLRANPSHDSGAWALTDRDVRLNAMLAVFESQQGGEE